MIWVNKNDIILKIIILSAIVFVLSGYLLMGWDKLLVYTLLVVNVLVMYYVRNMQVPMLMFIFMFTYNVHYLYNWAGVQLSPYEQFQSMEYYGISAMLNLLVFAGVILVVRLNGNKTRERTTFSFLKEKEKSFVWFWVCVAVCILILYYLQRQGTNLLFAEGDLYDLYRENLESISGFAVYFYIFFFLLFIYRPSPIYNIVIGFILAWYLLFALSRGTRMLMVPPVLIFFFYFFENKFKSSWIIIFSTIGLLLLRIIDRFKNNLPLFGGNEERGDILINNQSELLYGGNAVIGSVREIFISVVDRIELLGGYLITCILPPSLVPENMKYPHYLGTIHVDFGGGGIIVFAFYVILGVIGPFLLGMYLGGTINYVYESQRPNYYVMLFFVLSFFMITRWYSYDPNLLFRLSFYMLFVFAVFKLITKASYGKTKSVNS